MAKMTDGTLKAIIGAKLQDTLGWIGGNLQKDRQKALQFYRGEPFGNEQEGRSAVVSRDVAESIDAAMPSLIKIFASTDTYVVFSARKPQDEKAAQQKTDYTNYVFQTQENAFNLMQTSLKDGLLSKLGVFKSWWEESTNETPEEYEGLTKAQLLMLTKDENVRVVEQVSNPAPPPPPEMAMMPPNPMDDGQLYDVRIMRSNKSGRVCIEVIPPEEFLTERRTVSLDTCTFAAHRCSRSKSELIEMGFDKKQVMALAGGTDGLELNPEKVTRFSPDDDLAYQATNNLDPTLEKVFVSECYLKVDFNGDDIAEWRKVTVAGAEVSDILANDEVDGHPFNAWSPYLQPHKLIGESMADKTIDIQLTKSTVVREGMDGFYFNNMPQLGVIEGQVNMEDVLTRRPGGIIRMQRAEAVVPIPVMDNSNSIMAMVSYWDSVKESRTGIRRFTSGLQGDELNPYASTATGVNKVEDSSQDTLDLIARNYAEQALKPLFKRISELTTKYQDKPSTVKLRGQWVDVDPSSWSTEMDATVTVGLGSGNKDKVTSNLLAMLTQVDAPLVQLQGGVNGPLLTMANLYNKVTKLSESMGFKAADQFYTDPATQQQQQQPPKPDPKMIEVQGKLQLQREQGQIKLQQAQQKGQLDAQLEREKAERQAQQEAAQAQADIATDRMHAQNQAQLDQMKLVHEQQLEEMKTRHEMARTQISTAHDMHLKNAKAQLDAEIKKHLASITAHVKTQKGQRPSR